MAHDVGQEQASTQSPSPNVHHFEDCFQVTCTERRENDRISHLSIVKEEINFKSTFQVEVRNIILGYESRETKNKWNPLKNTRILFPLNDCNNHEKGTCDAVKIHVTVLPKDPYLFFHLAIRFTLLIPRKSLHKLAYRMLKNIIEEALNFKMPEIWEGSRYEGTFNISRIFEVNPWNGEYIIRDHMTAHF